MTRNTSIHRLTTAAIAKATPPSILEDGGGLKLLINTSNSRSWILRFRLHDRRRDIGLGSYPAVTLEDAREAADKIRKQVREGKDPFVTRSIERGAKTTFRAAFNAFFDDRKKLLTNGKHIKQWTSTMETYVFPQIGNRSVADITPQEIIEVLKPIWTRIPDTASKILQRMNAIFQIAIVLGQRTTANPCTGVKRVLGPLNTGNRNHASLPYAKLPAFIQRLRASRSQQMTKLALEFLILTAARSGEVRLAPPSEINTRTCLWTIPAERMKTRREHVVPLSPRAMQIYREARKLSPNSALIFPGPSGRAYSDMVFTKMMRDWGLSSEATTHGFRSTFKTWCSEVEKARDEVSETALAHIDKDKVRRAYNRSTYIEERKMLMNNWEAFATSKKTNNESPSAPSSEIAQTA